MNKYRFKENIIRTWNNCKDCPYSEFVSDDYSSDHWECTKIGYYIDDQIKDETIDYTNNDGILDNCPYLNTENDTFNKN